MTDDFDLIVIGSGPAGEKAAVKAAYFLHKVALVEKSDIFGGQATTMAIPTKVLKESSLYFSGKREKGLYGIDLHKNWEASLDQFMYRKNLLIKTQSQAVYENLIQHNVKIYHGLASFKDSHHIEVRSESGIKTIYGKNILISTGSKTCPPEEYPIDGERFHTPETILNMKRFPTSLCIIGAGAIGCEIASTFSTIGVKVYLINRGSTILPFCDQEIVRSLVEEMKNNGIELLFNTVVKSIKSPKSNAEPIVLSLQSTPPLELETDMILFSANRKGYLEGLNYKQAGIKVDEKGLIQIDSEYRTNIPHIYAVGDVIGFPSLANIGMDQGRKAVSNMFKINDMNSFSMSNLPYGIYTIPEVSTVGISEEKALENSLNFCIGRVYYSDSARGAIMGAKQGLLKFIVHRETQEILGVHIVGDQASELIHYGVELVQNRHNLKDIIEKNYNFPTLHELYKYAAYDALSRITGRVMKRHLPTH